MGEDGPLLWTELAKCENDPEWKGALPVQTYRTCAGRFLKRELEALPGRWPAFAVGREAFQAAAYLLTDRPVVGVPHPTGSHFSFQARIPDLARRALGILEWTEAAAGWLDSRSGSAG